MIEVCKEQLLREGLSNCQAERIQRDWVRKCLTKLLPRERFSFVTKPVF